ncbi:MAG: hypothetical protein NTX98_00270, partial [Candidatus Doudnabacteria bacterium]|nr:hypothetical protein [Candidatus Doudnabacteria bacterium]
MKSIKYIELGSFDNTKKCEHCGNNPVPHFVNWYFESVDVFLAPLRRFLIHNPFSRLLKKLGKVFNLPLKLVNLGYFFHAVSFQEDILKCKVRRAQVLWEEASKRGIEMKELLLFGRPFDVYMAESHKLKAISYKLI